MKASPHFSLKMLACLLAAFPTEGLAAGLSLDASTTTSQFTSLHTIGPPTGIPGTTNVSLTFSVPPLSPVSSTTTSNSSSSSATSITTNTSSTSSSSSSSTLSATNTTTITTTSTDTTSTTGTTTDTTSTSPVGGSTGSNTSATGPGPVVTSPSAASPLSTIQCIWLPVVVLLFSL